MLLACPMNPRPSLEPAVILSRRHLLASLGLALPATAVLTTQANATTANHKKHKSHHGQTTLASHKHHKPATPAAAPASAVQS
jgi:hypothetical protein